jgi:hypothetical protein
MKQTNKTKTNLGKSISQIKEVKGYLFLFFTGLQSTNDLIDWSLSLYGTEENPVNLVNPTQPTGPTKPVSPTTKGVSFISLKS